MTDAEIIHALRAQLDEANETILQLREERRRTLKAAGQFIGGPVHLTPAEWAICETLYRAKGFCHADVLVGSISVVTHRQRQTNDNSLKATISKLRRKLGALVPPISIKTSYGEGYYFDAESRTAFGGLRNTPEGSTS